MSIVPQVALVKPNREVRQYTEPSPEALREAISEANGSGQLTLQKGVYGAQNPGQNITVPLGIDIIVMPGADVSRVNFFDSDGNPFPNIFDFNNLGNIASVVNTIATGDGLSIDQPSGDVTLQVPDEGITNDLLAPNAVDIDILETGNTASAGQVLAYNGTVMQWQSADVVTEDPIGGTGLPGNPVNLKFKNSASISLGTNNNQLVANILNDSITQAMMSAASVSNEQLDSSGTANTTTFLGYSSGLRWKSVSAGDVIGGTFSENYTFSNSLTLSGGASSDADIEINGGASLTLSDGTDSGSLTMDGSTMDIVSGGGSIVLDADNNNVLSSVFVRASDRLEIDAFTDVVGGVDFTVKTDNLFVSTASDPQIKVSGEGYIDIPFYDKNTNPVDPPPGFIRFYAQREGSDNTGEVWFVEPGGDRARVNPA